MGKSPGVKKSRLLNLAMLVAGFGAGQGSVFLVQTWLMIGQQHEILALFGTHFSFAMLGIAIVEAGSITVLARKVSLIAEQESGRNELWRSFTETCCARLVFAILPISISGWIVLGATEPTFSSNFALYSAPAYILWAFNAAGLLDGVKLSGLSGVSGALCYIFPSIALFMAGDLALDRAGMIVGTAFTIGYFLTVVTQMVALKSAGYGVRLVTPTLNGLGESLRIGMSMLGTTLPGQAYFRLQLLLCSIALGAAGTAILVYVKQVTSAAIQIVGFVRRTEFPDLVRSLSVLDRPDVTTIFRKQMLGTRIAIVLAVAFGISGTALLWAGNPSAGEMGMAILAFAPTIFTSTVALTLNQGLAAIGRYWSITLVSACALIAGSVSSYLLINLFGVVAFAIADLMTNIVGSLIAIRLLSSRMKA